MKQIIIFLLVVIVMIMGYNVYKKYQRFNPPNYTYTVPESIDANHPNKSLLLDYYEAVSALDGFVITQWSVNGIDVRNPEKDNGETLAAVSEYHNRLADVSYFESQLTAAEVKEPIVVRPNTMDERKMIIAQMFNANPEKNKFQLGERSALVFEIQGLLNQKGDSIAQDGLYKQETLNALKSFEAKNGLFPDGKLDALTLNALLK
ncbi:MAG: peptidoglycan-binding domain-containing protein [Bacteroidota bacterium]